MWQSSVALSLGIVKTGGAWDIGSYSTAGWGTDLNEVRVRLRQDSKKLGEFLGKWNRETETDS